VQGAGAVGGALSGEEDRCSESAPRHKLIPRMGAVLVPESCRPARLSPQASGVRAHFGTRFMTDSLRVCSSYASRSANPNSTCNLRMALRAVLPGLIDGLTLDGSRNGDASPQPV
jgi:hypothetical protein